MSNMSSEDEIYHDDNDHDSDDDEVDTKKQTDQQDGFSVAKFLMGNIDEHGKLVKDENYDEEIVKAFDSTFVTSSLRDLEATKKVGSFFSVDSTETQDTIDSGYDYNKKNEDAIDFSEEANIGDLFDEMNNVLKNDPEHQNGDNDDYDDEPVELENLNNISMSEESDQKNVSSKVDVKRDSEGFAIPKLSLTTSISDDKKLDIEHNKEIKKLDTPLGAMLPSKYANADVTDLFPEFRRNQVLRFSRLFQRNKKGVFPQIWRGHRTQRKNRHLLEAKMSSIKVNSTSDNDDDDEYEWKFLSPNHEEMDLRQFLQEDAEYTLLKNEQIENDSKKGTEITSGEVPDWRHSASKYWYDKYKIAENGENFDYGFKLKTKNDDEDEEPGRKYVFNDPDDVFHLVTQTRWEDEIIWDGDNVRPQVLAKLNDKNLPSGWLPTGINRTASQFNNIRPNATTLKPQASASQKKSDKKSNTNDKNSVETNENTWWSIFPVENEELINKNWEDDIIWDAENMDHIPEPKLVVLDRNDENIIFDIPIDEAPDSTIDPTVKRKEKPTGIRKSRLLLGKAGVIAEPELIQPPSPPSTEKDPFNISNDEYYADKTTPQQQIKTSVAGNLIQHSIPAIELRPQFFPTFLNYQKLQSFHRPALKRYSYGVISGNEPHGVAPLMRYIKKKAKQREQNRIESGGGEMFFMRTPEDLTGKDGDLILAEYSEEFPPLMMQIGMATKIKNFYRRKHGKDNGPPPLKFGEIAYCQTSPFLGLLAPGQCLQAFENNMVRAPIYEHQVPDSDFLIIRTRDNYYIREVEIIYTVGQELPLMEVPGPNSKKSNNFIRDFLQVFIYRLFWKSTDTPRRIKMDDIKKAFPIHSESSIRKRLKQCADFKRTGMDSNWWVIKSDFRLPSEDEIRAMVTPEACCAYYSMLASEQRLKDGGYGEKYIFADEGDDLDNQSKIEDEVKAAPWHTTRAFCSAMKGKCLLQLTGVADPTGCGEGFSYIRIPNKPTQTKEEMTKNPVPKKIVSGTEADLRKLPLEKAKEMLRSYGFPEDEMKKLSRWEIIDVVRTYSTKKAKETEENEGDGFVNKFARGNRFSIAEHQERYKEECQRIFDLQNKVLASKEDLSTDEDESDDEDDSELEEMGKNIESLLTQKKTIHQISRDIEEEERKELKKMLMGDKGKKGDENPSMEDDKNFGNQTVGGKVLKIYRTYVTPEGQEFVRIETVRKPAVIDTYVKIRSSKDETYIKQFATALDDQQKEEKRKEKRRLQEQLRRMKRNQEREKLSKAFKNSYGLDMPEKPIKEKPLSARELMKIEKKRIREEKRREKELAKLNSNSKCSACGGTGHYRNNKSCPLYQAEETTMDSVQIQEDNLVKVDETKVVLNKAILKKYEDQAQAAEARKSLKTSRTNSKDSVTPGVRGRKRKSVNPSGDNMDYLQKPEYRAHNRRRVDPLVVLCEIFEECINEMKALPNTRLFHMPVNVKEVPDYYNIITNPMDLQTMRENVRAKVYKDRESFLKDLTTIHANCVLYNGQMSPLSITAQEMVEVCANKLLQRESEILKLEKMINPIRDESDLVAFSYILKTIVNERLKTIPESWPFKQPVNPKNIPKYFEIIKNPMDLETIELNLNKKYYKNRAQFMKDIELIVENSILFNGIDSSLTAKATEIADKARSELATFEDQLNELEAGIRADFGGDFDEFDETSRMSFESGSESMQPTPAKRTNTKEETNIEDDLRISDDDDNDDVFPPEQPNISGSSLDEHLVYQHEQSMDGFDQNYDPSEFLLNSGFGNGDETGEPDTSIQSQPDETGLEQDLDLSASSNDDNDDDDDDDIWF